MLLQWNLYNETKKVHCLYKIMFIITAIETTCLERPLNVVVALYRFHCISGGQLNTLRPKLVSKPAIASIISLLVNTSSGNGLV